MKSKLLILVAVVGLFAGYVIAAEQGSMKMDETRDAAVVEGTDAAMDMGETLNVAAEEAVEAVAEQAAEVVVVDNKICPISGEKIGEMGEGKVVEYDGKQYKLCCPACEKDFLKDPAAAVQKIEASMAAEAK